MSLTIFLLIIIFITLTLLFFRLKRIRKKTGVRRVSMVEWMKMSSDDRNANDNKQRLYNMKRKKILLSNIRKEYKQLVKKSK